MASHVELARISPTASAKQEVQLPDAQEKKISRVESHLEGGSDI
jgi:hypothetical protein